MTDKKKVMIVEDDPFVMDIYVTKISKEGFEAISAANGKEAIKKFEEGVVPDMILLDILMPEVNGFEVLKKIRSTGNLKKVPVILLTNLSQKEEVNEGFDLGADEYLIKSHFNPSEVMEKIRKYL